MKITQPGYYRLTEDFSVRGAWAIQHLSVGAIIQITQIDALNRHVIGPELLNWVSDEMPCEPATQEEIRDLKENKTMSDLNPTVFAAQEQCACECQQADLLTDLRLLHTLLKEKCPGVAVAVGFRIEPTKEYYYVKIGENSHVFGATIEEVTAKADKITSRLSSPDYLRAVELKRQADELFSKVAA